MFSSKGIPVLIDGPAFTHRWYHSFAFAAKNGQDVYAKSFALNNVRSLLATSHAFRLENIESGAMPEVLRYNLLKERPNSVMFFYDHGDGGRTEFFPDYKKERRATVRDPVILDFFSETIRFVTNEGSSLVLPQMGGESLKDFTAEADDMISTVSIKLTEMKIPHMIMTHDIDVMHLVNDANKVAVYDPRTKTILTESDIEKRVKVKASQIVDFKILCGDKCDNIPGVRRVGKVRAQKMLQKYGSLSEILKHAANDEKGAKMKEILKNCGPQVELSRRLVQHVDCSPLLPYVMSFLGR